MKKVFKCLFWGLIFSTIFTTKNTAASPLEKLIDSEDYNEVCQTSEDIINFINTGPAIDSETRAITLEDIDFDNALKEHLDVPLLTDKVIHAEDMIDQLEQCPYLWVVSVKADDYIYEARIARAMDENEQRTGEWEIEYVAGFGTDTLTIEELLLLSCQNNDVTFNEYDYKLLCGTEPIRYPFFVAIDKSKGAFVIPARDSAACAITDSSKEQRAYSQDSNGSNESSDYDGFQVYDYKNVLEAVQSTSFISTGQSSGDAVLDIAQKPAPYAFYIIIGILAIVIITIGVKLYMARK